MSKEVEFIQDKSGDIFRLSTEKETETKKINNRVGYLIPVLRLPVSFQFGDNSALAADSCFFSESPKGKEGNENMLITDSIRDAEVADSRDSNRTSLAHGETFPDMNIAAFEGCITREKNDKQARIENRRVFGELKDVLG
jgi:hypothetical protein